MIRRRVPIADARIAVIGDVGGHAGELRHELHCLGADDGLVLPEDLVVVQVGDLIHRGPDSDAVVALVDTIIKRQGDQWIQLIGNHEANYLRDPVFAWQERLTARSCRILRRWWTRSLAQAATAVSTSSESFLITHAGVTYPFWRDVLGAPATAVEAADRINALARAGDRRVFRCGTLLAGRDPDYLAGPIWADAATELIASWRGIQLPFSQIHGHSSIADWHDRDAESTGPMHLIDHTAKHEIIDFDGGRVVGVDPGHLTVPIRPWSSFVLPFARRSIQR